MDAAALAARAKTLAREAGFDLAGVARPDRGPDLSAFARWVGRGYAGEMAYLTTQVAKRTDLRAAFPWARSILCVGLQYDTPAPYSTEAPSDRGWIARYAWGDDYHDVMKAMLDRLVERLARRGGPFRGADVRGHRADRGAGVGGGGGARGVGEEHLPPAPGARLVVLPGRGGDGPRPPRGRAATRHVRKLHRLPGRVPHRGPAQRLRARRHPLHQLPHDRGEGCYSCPSSCRPGPPRLRVRHLPGRVPLEPATPGPGSRVVRGAAGARVSRPRGPRPPGRRGLPRALPPEPREAGEAPRPPPERGGRPRQRPRSRAIARSWSASLGIPTPSSWSTRAGRSVAWKRGAPPPLLPAGERFRERGESAGAALVASLSPSLSPGPRPAGSPTTWTSSSTTSRSGARRHP